MPNINIPDSVTYIGDGAFYGCTNLTNIDISNNVTYINSWTFAECTNLININIPDRVTSIGESSFVNCTNLTNINIPDGVTYIGDCTFSCCTNLTNINIPDSVTLIQSCAFSDCINLTNINLPDNITTIENYTFSNCINLTNINIPDSVDYIGEFDFADCTNLTNINIPYDVTYIGYGAFADCTNLTNINIPDNVTTISGFTFTSCSSLEEIKFLNNDTYIASNSFAKYNNIKSVYCYKNSTADNPNNFPDSNVTFYYLDNEEYPENKKAKLIVSSEECKTGEFVDIYVNIKNNPGIAVYNLKVNFDRKKLTPISISQGINGGDKITSNLNEPNIKPETLNFVTALWTNFSDMKYNGYLFKLRFKVKENTAFEEIPITLECTEEGLLDENYREVTPEIQNGTISIINDYYFGDINMDRNINNIDLLMLNQYIAEYKNVSFNSVQKHLADVYRDEIINVADLVLFKQYLAGWDVDFGNDDEFNLSTFDNKSIKLNLKNTYISEDEIKISAVLNDNPGISAFKFILNYDDSILEPIFIKKGDIIKEGDIISNINSNNKEYITALWSNATDINDNGSIFEVTFKIKDKQKDITNLGLTFDERDIINQTFKKISANNINKKIYLTPPDENFVYGDIDGDKIITGNDAALILQYVLNPANIEFNNTQIRAAMVSDSSSVITTEDIIHILKKALDYDYIFPVTENSL